MSPVPRTGLVNEEGRAVPQRQVGKPSRPEWRESPEVSPNTSKISPLGVARWNVLNLQLGENTADTRCGEREICQEARELRRNLYTQSSNMLLTVSLFILLLTHDPRGGYSGVQLPEEGRV